MPRAPIVARRGFFDYMKDKSIRLLDWCAVDTELGVMVEPRQDYLTVPTAVAASNGLVAVDLLDQSFTSLSYVDEGTFYSQYGTAGPQFPVDFSQ